MLHSAASIKPIAHAIYLHGFASSPASTKARRFARECAALGIGFSCPDFNQPDFETMTVTRMLADAARAVDEAGDGPILLIGSSLGAFVAVHAAERDRTGRISQMLLLAPALFHLRGDKPPHVSATLFDDARRHDALSLQLRHPTIVFQGRHDASVPAPLVEEWAAGQPMVELHMMNDDHQLHASMDEIWARVDRSARGPARG